MDGVAASGDIYDGRARKEVRGTLGRGREDGLATVSAENPDRDVDGREHLAIEVLACAGGELLDDCGRVSGGEPGVPLGREPVEIGVPVSPAERPAQKAACAGVVSSEPPEY